MFPCIKSHWSALVSLLAQVQTIQVPCYGRHHRFWPTDRGLLQPQHQKVLSCGRQAGAKLPNLFQCRSMMFAWLCTFSYFIYFTVKSGIVQQGLSGSTGAILLQRHACHCDMLCWQFASGFDRHTETWTQTSGSEGWSASLLGRMTEQFDIPLNLRVGKRNFLRFAQIVAQICPKLIHFRINSLQGVTLGLSPPPTQVRLGAPYLQAIQVGSCAG